MLLFIDCWFLTIFDSPCTVEWVNVGSSFSTTTLLIHNFTCIHALSKCPAITAVLCCCTLGGSVGEVVIKLVGGVGKSVPLLIFTTKHPPPALVAAENGSLRNPFENKTPLTAYLP